MMNPSKREAFRSEPSYLYESFIALVVLAILGVISVLIKLPVTVTAWIVLVELVICGVQWARG